MPVPGSSAMTSLKGVQKTRLSSTSSGVASNFVRAISAGERVSRSPVRKSQARMRLPTLAGVIWASGENRVPPRSPPQCSQPAAGAAADSTTASNTAGVQNKGANSNLKILCSFPATFARYGMFAFAVLSAPMFLVMRNSDKRQSDQGDPGFLFRLFSRIRRASNAPRVIFFLGLRYSFECRLIGLFVDLRLLLIGFPVVVAVIPLAAAHLGVRGRRDQRQHHRCPREGLHRLGLPSCQSLLSGRMMATTHRL